MNGSPNLPLRHTSTFRSLTPFADHKSYAVEKETPLFAANFDFALRAGGALTHAFLKALPLALNQNVVVDSSLVWLSPGLAHGFVASGPLAGPRAKLGFLHEPFPGITTGVCGDSNRNLHAIHWLGVFGLDCTPELAEGELSFDSLEEAASFWLPTETLEYREKEIARRMAEGQLTRIPLPLATIVEFGWGTLLRSRPAREPGFQFVIRVTSGDDRPHVNGLRNHAQV